MHMNSDRDNICSEQRDDLGMATILHREVIYPTRGRSQRQFAMHTKFYPILIVWIITYSVSAQDTVDPERSAAEMLTPDTDRAITQGLKYLASRQNEDGSFGMGGFRSNVAICGLAGLSMVASGSTPGRGPYGSQIDRCVRYILNSCDEDGFIHVPDDGMRGPMYGHGFATLFLAEVYGMALDPLVRVRLSKAVERIIDTQNDEGGWRYQPVRADADISVTICQVMALRAAKNAGLYVPSETIDRCIDYVEKSQNPDGGFMYMIHGGPSEFPRSAAGVVALYSAGIYEGEAIVRGLEYLMRFVPRGEPMRRQSHYFYGHYYAIQAMWQAGGKYWSTWYPAIRDELVTRQLQDGSWLMAISSEYGTAMATIILQMPNNQLPIFQR